MMSRRPPEEGSSSQPPRTAVEESENPEEGSVEPARNDGAVDGVSGRVDATAARNPRAERRATGGTCSTRSTC